MKEQETISNNELIANFMEVELREGGYCYDKKLQFIRGGDYGEWADTYKFIISGVNKKGEPYSCEDWGYLLDSSNLKYHVSYDWLIPVINKISELQFTHPMVDQTLLCIRTHIIKPNTIDIICESVVEFIKFQNENK